MSKRKIATSEQKIDSFIQKKPRAESSSPRAELKDDEVEVKQSPAISPELVLSFDDSDLKFDEFESRFDQLASLLLNDYHLLIKNKRYRVVELEMYYVGGEHKDDFAHATTMQLDSYGRWYFHTMGNKAGAYKGGTYKGLDLSFGKPHQAHGGVLLRSIQSVETGKVIEGPCLLVNHILESNKSASIADFVRDHVPNLQAFSPAISEDFLSVHWSDRASTPGALCFVPVDKKLKSTEFVKCPRVGLTLKKSGDGRETFIMKPYRYISAMGLKHIKKNKQTILSALHHQGHSAQKIADLTGTKLATVKSTTEDFDTALAKHSKSKRPLQAFRGQTLGTAKVLIDIYAAWCAQNNNVNE